MEKTTEANGITICYETFGSDADPTVLLIMGLGAQMIHFPDGFCERLAARGYHVVRYDNRDAGLSQSFDDAGVPPLDQILAGTAEVPYTLEDMAEDAAGLLDALGIDRAHAVGVSMGGMIAQLLAVRHPRRVLSMTSIMSTLGGEDTEFPTPEAMALLTAPRPTSREEAIELAVKGKAVVGSPGYPDDEGYVRELAGRAFDRSYRPAGFARQLGAVMASQSRRELLGSVAVPCAVIHGEEDTLVPVVNGRRTAEALGDACDLVTIPGMGHDLPQALWDRLVDEIVKNAERA